MTRNVGWLVVLCLVGVGCGDDDRSGPPRDSGTMGMDAGGGDTDGGGDGDGGGGGDDAGGEVDGGGGGEDAGGADAGRDAGMMPVDCSGAGDAFDMSYCRFIDVFCSYGVTCPAVELPSDRAECEALLSMLFASPPSRVDCGECLDALAEAVAGFAEDGTCPPPEEPPMSVTIKCDTDPAVDADGDGNPSNDVDACGEPDGGGGGMGGDPGDPPPPPRP